MKKIVKIPISYESRLSSEELEQKIKKIIAERENEERELSAEKGRELFLWTTIAENEYRLNYYHSYKSDMCDTSFEGTLTKGLSGCSLDGYIKKPKGIWAVFWTIIAATIVITAALGIGFILYEGIEMGFFSIFFLILALVAFVEVNLLMFDKKRLKSINDYLREFTAAENIDALSGESEEDERG